MKLTGQFRQFLARTFRPVRFCSVVLFLQVPKKCTDLDPSLSLVYNLIFGTCANSHARTISCLGAHDVRTITQRSCGLCGDSRSSLRRFVEGVGNGKSGFWNDEFSDNAIFQFDITSCFCYVVVAISTWRIFGNTARFDRVCLTSFICTVVKFTRVRWTNNPQICRSGRCCKCIAPVAELIRLKMSCRSWGPGIYSHRISYGDSICAWMPNFLALWDHDCLKKIALCMEFHERRIWQESCQCTTQPHTLSSRRDLVGQVVDLNYVINNIPSW